MDVFNTVIITERAEAGEPRLVKGNTEEGPLCVELAPRGSGIDTVSGACGKFKERRRMKEKDESGWKPALGYLEGD